MDKPKELTKVFVYGTLRVGQGNYFHLLEDKPGVNYLGESTIRGFKMVSLGGFPAIFTTEEEKDIIYGDVFEVDDKVLENLDRLEGYPGWYDRVTVDTDYGDAFVYTMDNIERRNLVPSGNWVEFKNKPQEI